MKTIVPVNDRLDNVERNKLLVIFDLITSLNIDLYLFVGIVLITVYSSFILYSAGNEQIGMVIQKIMHVGIGILIMIVLAQIPSHFYEHVAPIIFGIGVFLLIAVFIAGYISKGAQRWLGVGGIRFQPSEIMKLSIPLVLGWYYNQRVLPPTWKDIGITGLIILIPAILTIKQPDLGSGLILIAIGLNVLVLAGISWKIIVAGMISLIASVPVALKLLHGYQLKRILTFLDPENDPLGAGYHIIQSKIAIGSGGFAGKGWLLGTQAHLHFLPEHTTDFIFAVCGEEFGFLGCMLLLILYAFIIVRCLYISLEAQDTFSRLVAGSISFSLFLSVFINIGMVIGILPVVGVPLPLVSYGGTSTIMTLASFGILTSIHYHRKLLAK